MSEEKSLAVHETKSVSTFSGNVADFETGQRMARALAESDIVPSQYKGKLSNCLVALEVAHRTGSSVLAVMQNLNVINGKPSWSAQYIIASVNASGRYTPLRFELVNAGAVKLGNGEVKNVVCYAYATDKKTGEVLKGPPVSIETAVKEGWYQKSGSKWPSMPELMLQYRAATFFGRLYCPELLLGMQSEDEVRDVAPAAEKHAASEGLNERIRAKKKPAPPADIVVEAKVVEEPAPAGEPEKKEEGFY